MEASGMPPEAVNIMEVYFSAGRIRDAVTFVMETFQGSKESADSCMAAARRTIQESLEASRAQTSGIHAALEDAGNLDSRLRELTQAKFEAEQRILTLQRQVEEREAYQSEVERLTALMKDEAQNERQKMSEIALGMSAKQKVELENMAAKHKAEVEELCERHIVKMKEIQDGHTKTVEAMSSTIQELKDNIVQLEKELEEKGRKLDATAAKKKNHRNAKEAIMAEVSQLKHALSMADREGKEHLHRFKSIEKENMVLKELAAKLESDVRRGRVVIEGEAHRHAFEAWKSSMIPQNPYSSAPRTRADSRSRTERQPQSQYVYYSSAPTGRVKPTTLRPYS
eukprot:TRINITY_DN23724_c0_g1_i2.p1 TRINITY_DN23724_c0_g1~~TRINITY_DN23724_c0_g1_i2.p1  ORF type:complete len:385 (+),score=138.82 TRINITY_DN23724_c0_g1_i2:137-1156(+)